MSIKGDPVFTFSLPGGAARPPFPPPVNYATAGNLSAAICSAPSGCPEASWMVRDIGVSASAVSANVT